MLSKLTIPIIVVSLLCFSFVRVQNDIAKVRLPLECNYAFTRKLKVSNQASANTILNKIADGYRYTRSDKISRAADLTDRIFKMNCAYFHPDATI